MVFNLLSLFKVDETTFFFILFSPACQSILINFFDGEDFFFGNIIKGWLPYFFKGFLIRNSRRKGRCQAELEPAKAKIAALTV